MKTLWALLAFLPGVVAQSDGPGRDELPNPVNAVITLLTNLIVKVEDDQKRELAAWKLYDGESSIILANQTHAVETRKDEKAKYEAKISECNALIASKTDELNGFIAQINFFEGEQTRRQEQRRNERKEYEDTKNLLDGQMEMLERAEATLSEEMEKNPAAFSQINQTTMHHVLQLFQTLVESSGIESSGDGQLTALLQRQAAQAASNDDLALHDVQPEEEDELEKSAPKPITYKFQSQNVLDLIAELKDKAETMRRDATKQEQTNQGEYKIFLAQSDYELKENKQFRRDAKAFIAAQTVQLNQAINDLSLVEKDLKQRLIDVENTKLARAQKLSDHEASAAGFAAELQALRDANKALQDMSRPAGERVYADGTISAPVLLQTKAEAKYAMQGTAVLDLIKKLARESHSSALFQLSSKIMAVMKFGSRHGRDPFAKVRGLLEDLIEKLEQEKLDEADHFARCNEEQAENEANRVLIQGKIDKYKADIARTAAELQAKRDMVAAAQENVRNLDEELREMEERRLQEAANYKAFKEDLDAGISGVRQAQKLLTDYYEPPRASLAQTGSQEDIPGPPPPPEHIKSKGPAINCRDILINIEADFVKDLAQKKAIEEAAKALYIKESGEKKVEREVSISEGRAGSEEIVKLEPILTSYVDNKETQDGRLQTVLDVLKRLENECSSPAVTYEQRQQRRKYEIKGLKKGLAILNGEIFVQEGKRLGQRAQLRGTHVFHLRH